MYPLIVAALVPVPAPPDAERTAFLIRQLNNPAFARREAANRELAFAGEKALPVLRAALAHKDAEVRSRAAVAVRAVILASRVSKSTGLETEVIDPGGYVMGSVRPRKGYREDEWMHPVRINRPFLMGKYEVTQAEYRAVIGDNPSWFSSLGDGKEKVAGVDTRRFPVENVSWFDAVAFCNALSKADGYPAYYTLEVLTREKGSITTGTVGVVGGNGYRLPTEAEWEFACRAGNKASFHYGSNTGKEANLKPGPSTGYGAAPYWPTPGRTVKVGSYPANPFGLYEMHGNAAEWCQDWYDGSYYATSPIDDPLGPTAGRHRVQRGGSWMLSESGCRSASRMWGWPGDATMAVGFRVARTP